MLLLFAIGAKYKDDCPREDKIPIYLIVMGCFLIIRNLSNMCSRASSRNDEDENDEKNPAQKCCDSMIDLFLFCWFIAGNYWIYHIYEPSFDKSDKELYCHKTLYLFSFWILNATYILIGFLCCCTCVVGICAAVVTVNSDDENL